MRHIALYILWLELISQLPRMEYHAENMEITKKIINEMKLISFQKLSPNLNATASPEFP
jgi:hypothetical protein